jgi:hypothetical protein
MERAAMKRYRKAVLRWTVQPAAQERLEYISGVDDDRPCPKEGAVIIRPFLVDPVTKEEVPVRVVQVLDLAQEDPPVLAILVTRDQ